MQQMLRPLQATKIATAIGPGTQAFPWISIRDLCRAMEFFITHEETRGVYNLVAPQQISQYAFSRAMGKGLSGMDNDGSSATNFPYLIW